MNRSIGVPAGGGAAPAAVPQDGLRQVQARAAGKRACRLGGVCAVLWAWKRKPHQTQPVHATPLSKQTPKSTPPQTFASSWARANPAPPLPNPPTAKTKIKKHTLSLSLSLTHTNQTTLKQTQADYFEQLGETVKGTALNGLRYEPMFPYFADRAESGAFKVRTWVWFVGNVWTERELGMCVGRWGDGFVGVYVVVVCSPYFADVGWIGGVGGGGVGCWGADENGFEAGWP